jgi:hypothetical protein
MGAAAASRRPADSAIAGWAVLAIDALRVAIPQADVRRIGLLADLGTATAPAGGEVGWLMQDGDAVWPAYSLDQSLALERSVPTGRLCVFFGADAVACGIVCSRVWSLAADGDLVPQPLAGCLRGPRSPVLGLARFEQGVVLVSSGAALAGYLKDLVETGRDRAG